MLDCTISMPCSNTPRLSCAQPAAEAQQAQGAERELHLAHHTDAVALPRAQRLASSQWQCDEVHSLLLTCGSPAALQAFSTCLHGCSRSGCQQARLLQFRQRQAYHAVLLQEGEGAGGQGSRQQRQRLGRGAQAAEAEAATIAERLVGCRGCCSPCAGCRSSCRGAAGSAIGRGSIYRLLCRQTSYLCSEDDSRASVLLDCLRCADVVLDTECCPDWGPQAAALAEDGEAVGGLMAEVSGAAADIDRAEVALFKCDLVPSPVPHGSGFASLFPHLPLWLQCQPLHTSANVLIAPNSGPARLAGWRRSARAEPPPALHRSTLHANDSCQYALKLRLGAPQRVAGGAVGQGGRCGSAGGAGGPGGERGDGGAGAAAG